MADLDLPKDVFTVRFPIRFSDSDPAGIVFFPVYFRMFNDVLEDWIRQVLGVAWEEEFFTHQHMFPLVHVEADFKEARSMGQTVDLSLVLEKIGRTSFTYTIVGHDAGREMMRARCVTCVASKETMETIPIPAAMRDEMERYLEKMS